MLFDTYESRGLLFNMNFKESAGKFAAYRGDLVLTPGEAGDALGHRRPPTATFKSTVVLAEGDKIGFLSGILDDLADLPKLLEYYQPDFAADVRAIIFVVNIAKPLLIDLGGVTFAAIPLQEGLPWNELAESAGLEKGDFKGQSAAEKVVTLYEGLADYRPQGEPLAYADALARVVGTLKRSGRGPV